MPGRGAGGGDGAGRLSSLPNPVSISAVLGSAVASRRSCVISARPRSIDPVPRQAERRLRLREGGEGVVVDAHAAVGGGGGRRGGGRGVVAGEVGCGAGGGGRGDGAVGVR